MRLETGVVDNAPRTSAVRWSSREFRIRVGILAGYVVLALLRVPQIALHGRFWAEEGTVYFSQALEKGCLAYLFTPALGYYSLVNKVACLLATVPPLEFAPLVTVYVSLVIQAVPVALVLFCGIPGLKGLGHQAVAVALLLVVQPNQEVWLNTINGQFHLCIATGLILVSRARSRRGHVARLVVLAVAGLTGVLSCLLLPLYIVEWLSDRRKRRAHEVVALSVACLVQLVAVVASPSREAGMFWRVLPFALLTRQWIQPVLGWGLADRAAGVIQGRGLYLHGGLALLALLPHACALAYVWLCGRRASVLLFLAGTVIAVVSFAGSLEARSLTDILGHMYANTSGRYYFAPNVLLALSLLLACRFRVSSRVKRGIVFCKVGRWVSVGVLVSILATGVVNTFLRRDRDVWYFEGPDWREEVRAWRAGEGEILHTWPSPWGIRMPSRTSELPPHQ